MTQTNTNPTALTVKAGAIQKNVKQAGQLTVRLRSYGNPDFGQYAPVSNPQLVIVNSVEEAVQVAMEYREFWSLGGGNWGKLYVMQGRKKVARIHYNGTVSYPGQEHF